jgi:protein gp37
MQKLLRRTNVKTAQGDVKASILTFQPAALDLPKRWKQPRGIFVNSMSDLFQEGVGIDYVKRVFEVMNECSWHQFQVLTKRPEIALAFADQLLWTKNIWMGTSVENLLVTHRISSLRQIPAHTRFLSLEPLLGPLPRVALAGIHWVIVGGESGPGVRLMYPSWVRQIRDRCTAQAVPFFFKQWGGTNKKRAGRMLDGEEWNGMPGKTSLLKGRSDERQPANCLVG